MKLIHAPASPFARKVRVFAREANLLDALELVPTAVLPTQCNPLVEVHNPLGKIPVLLTGQGEALYDSRVICEYLDSLAATSLFAPLGQSRWHLLTIAALADGVMDAALLVRYEDAVRPREQQWSNWRNGQTGKIERALDALEKAGEPLEGEPNIAQIGVACALGYLDFRLTELDWRNQRPVLQAFYERFCARESMRESAPA